MSGQTAKRTVLVMDDVEMNRAIAQKVFQAEYYVLSAENGQKGMELLRQYDVDLVLLDISMPVMDGFEVLKAMKAEKALSEIPVVVITGEIKRAEKQALELGADDFIEKLYDFPIMKKRVENLIDRYRLRELRHLQNTQEKALDLFDSFDIAYWEWSKKNGYYHSKGYEKYAVSDMPPEEVWDAEAPYRYVHPSDVPMMKRFMQRLTDDEIRKSAVIRCLLKDGTYRWTEMFAFTEIGADKQPIRLVSAMRDVDREWITSLSAEQKNTELNRIIEATSGGVVTYRVGEQLMLTSCTKRLYDKLGYSDEEMINAAAYDAYAFIHPSDVPFVKQNILHTLETDQPVTLSYRIRKKDGSYLWFRSVFYIYDAQDDAPTIYAVLTDIAQANAEYEEALNQTNEMIVIADWESREILYLNQAAAGVGGHNVSDMFGKKCSQIVQHCDECCSYCFKDDLTYEQLLVRELSVGRKYFQTKGKRIDWNGRPAFVEYVSDVTAQHNMTEKAVFERRLLSAATKVLYPLCVILNLTQDTYRIVDSEMLDVRKVGEEGSYSKLVQIGVESVDAAYREAFEATFAAKSMLQAYARGETTVTLTHLQKCGDGQYHWNRTSCVFADQLFDGDLYAISFTDCVDEQKSSEAALQTALAEANRANHAKTAFLSRISHDMRTPLNGILGLTAILSSSVTDEKVSRNLKELELSAKYLLNLINDTLDVSRIENGKMELHSSVFDGREVFNNAVNLLEITAKAKNVHLNIRSEEMRFELIYSDPDRIQQIFMNVVGNAVKFSPEGGRVDITASTLEIEDHVSVNRFVVRDYGSGMSAEFLPHLFEAFSQEDDTRTATTQGTGLGMTITKNLVELLDGSIEVESEPGKGSCFTIVLKLPIATDEQVEQWKKKRIYADDYQELFHKRVLLCEDHPLNTMIATKLLETKNIFVEHAENGKIGVDMFSGSRPGYYDAILMDIRMPVMDGLAAAAAIRSLPRRDARYIPIIAMTANALKEDIAQTKNAGMDAHLSKPIQTDLLFGTLSSLLKINHNRRKQMILIVDDAEVNRAVIRTTLENDYDLLEAENGRKALEILHSTQGIDAVITDIQMPVMNGDELIRCIRSEDVYRHLVIIANTQFGNPEQEEQLLALGADDFVYKPTTPKIVEIRVRNALRKI